MKLVANRLEMLEYSNYIFNVIFSVDVFFTNGDHTRVLTGYEMIKYPGDDDISFTWMPKLDNFNNEEKLRNTPFHISFNVTAKYRFTFPKMPHPLPEIFFD